MGSPADAASLPLWYRPAPDVLLESTTPRPPSRQATNPLAACCPAGGGTRDTTTPSHFAASSCSCDVSPVHGPAPTHAPGAPVAASDARLHLRGGNAAPRAQASVHRTRGRLCHALVASTLVLLLLLSAPARGASCVNATVCDPTYGSVPLSCQDIVATTRRHFSDPATCNVMACIAAGCPQGCACYPVNGGAYGMWGIAPQELSPNSSVCPSNATLIVQADVNAACAALILANHGYGAWAACTPPANDCPTDFRATGCWCDLFPPTTTTAAASLSTASAAQSSTTLAASTAVAASTAGTAAAATTAAASAASQATLTAAAVTSTNARAVSLGAESAARSTTTLAATSTTSSSAPAPAPPPSTVHIDGTVQVNGAWTATSTQVTIFTGNASSTALARLTVNGTATLAGDAVVYLPSVFTDTQRVRLVLATSVNGAFRSVSVKGPPGDCTRYTPHSLSLPTLYAVNVVATPGECPASTDHRFVLVAALLGGVFGVVILVAALVWFLESYHPHCLPNWLGRGGHRLRASDLYWC